MEESALTRRRVITITAAMSVAAVFPGRAMADTESPVSWRGSVLGAQASIEIHHSDRKQAALLVQDCLAEVRRLEQQFSLYQPDSAISALNRTGILVAPDPDMVALLRASLAFADLTNGVFDPTVQPLWGLYADHFSSAGASPKGPSGEKLAAALSRIGYREVSVTRDRIALMKHGAAVTFNGIAQGYATDRVVDMLRGAGLSTTMVNMGEIRAIGARLDGTPWQVGLADPDRPGEIIESIKLVDRAVATSAGAGFRFDRQGRFTHLFDPATGQSPHFYRTVSVVAPTATEADALSTAFSLMLRSQIGSILAGRPEIQVHLVESGGRSLVLNAAKT